MLMMKRARKVASLFSIVALLAVFAWGASATVAPERASAWCQSTSGTGCPPGSGYSFDTVFNCGVLNQGQYCWKYSNNSGTFNEGVASVHSFGWGSADYDGGGVAQPSFCALLPGSCKFGGTSTGNLIRACYFNTPCNDQSADALKMGVTSMNGNHTIIGHGKA